MPKSTVAELIAAVPELNPLLEQHVSLHDEVLPHVFFGDVTRFIQAELASRKPDLVIRTMIVLEGAITASDAKIRNLVEASFLENLETRELALLQPYAMSGMKLALLREQCRRISH